MLHVLHLFPPSLIEIRPGGFGFWDICRIGYLGLVCIGIFIILYCLGLRLPSITHVHYCKRCYCFIIFVFISVSPILGRFLFSWFPVQSLLFAPKYLLYTPKSRATLVSTCGTVRVARLEGGGSLESYVFLIRSAV